MRFIAFETAVPGATPDDFTEDLLDAEVAEIWRLHQAGAIREIYYRADRKAKVIVLECADIDEARSVIDGLPLVREKLIDFEITGLVPYRGFARLGKAT